MLVLEVNLRLVNLFLSFGFGNSFDSVPLLFAIFCLLKLPGFEGFAGASHLFVFEGFGTVTVEVFVGFGGAVGLTPDDLSFTIA